MKQLAVSYSFWMLIGITALVLHFLGIFTSPSAKALSALLYLSLIAFVSIHAWQSARAICDLPNAAEKLTAPISKGTCLAQASVALLMLSAGVLASMPSPLFLSQTVNSISVGFVICSGISIFAANSIIRVTNRRLPQP